MNVDIRIHLRSAFLILYNNIREIIKISIILSKTISASLFFFRFFAIATQAEVHHGAQQVTEAGFIFHYFFADE